MSEQIEINFSSSALGKSGCILNLFRTVVEGYKEKAMPARMVYGIGVHKFINIMYLTGGHIPTARKEAIDIFNSIPKIDNNKSMHMSDANHMASVALWTWEMCVKREEEFEILELPDTDGSMKPATEVSFSIPYYEDNIIKVNWCGTLDRIGKIKNGIYLIPDWKTTSSWNEREYFTQYELARAPRGYVLALKMMSELYPDSILGQIGKMPLGVRFDGIFVKPAINDVKFARSDVMRVSDTEIAEFRHMLDDKCRELSQAIKTGYMPKQGILNGSCDGKWGNCAFWNCCKLPDQVADVLLKRDFEKKPFNPLAYND